ncbi:integrator complex subunit 6-like [Anopheles marshallii]|uniref:integrator complex subunit 6-like n=1 Tax=Anopheles marshallii TaxID=1521116 RepID=UPI00237A3586|nr:integrator complex subunit 6-like [Anopheles marshallii]
MTTAIIFLLNNTPSMLQTTMMNGVRNSYIDIAKQTVETFVQLRCKDENVMSDRYMLLTYDTPPNHMKVSWDASMDQFMNAVKTLECTGSTSERNALGNLFEMLNQERMVFGGDTYGYGRCPSTAMFCFFVLITNYHDFPKISDTTFLPLSPNVVGSQLTKEPFRWDQRLFALVLGSTKSPPYIKKMSLAMGGWCMPIKSKGSWYRSISRLAKNLKVMLMISFIHETILFKSAAETNIYKLEPTKYALLNCGETWKGLWPVPESYWPDDVQNELPPRDAFPVMRILPESSDEPVWMANFPVDKYCVETRTSTDKLPTTDPGKVWPVVIMSTTHRKEQPFGYIKRECGTLYFYISTYNYPELHRLMTENFPNFNARNVQFINALQNYISMIPSYYRYYLSKALSGIVESTVLEMVLRMECANHYNKHLLDSFCRMREAAKLSRMRMCDYVSKQQGNPTAKQQETTPLIEEHPLLKLRKKDTQCTAKTIVVPTIERSTLSPDYRKLYAIDRKDLLDMLNRMRNAFYCPENMSYCMNSLKHSVPIAVMQQYTATQQNMTMLRTLTVSDNTENIQFSPAARYTREQSQKLTAKRMKLL